MNTTRQQPKECRARFELGAASYRCDRTALKHWRHEATLTGGRGAGVDREPNVGTITIKWGTRPLFGEDVQQHLDRVRAGAG